MRAKASPADLDGEPHEIGELGYQVHGEAQHRGQEGELQHGASTDERRTHPCYPRTPEERDHLPASMKSKPTISMSAQRLRGTAMEKKAPAPGH